MGFLAMLIGAGWIAFGVFALHHMPTDLQLAIAMIAFAAGSILILVGGAVVEVDNLIKKRMPEASPSAD